MDYVVVQRAKNHVIVLQQIAEEKTVESIC